MFQKWANELIGKFIRLKSKVADDPDLDESFKAGKQDALDWGVGQIVKAVKKAEKEGDRGGRPFTVYLSGRIDGLTFEQASAQRNRVTAELEARGIAVRDPMRGKEHLAGMSRITAENMAKIKERTYTVNEITTRDIHDLRMSDAILVLTGDVLSWGTQGEFWYMVWMTDKPKCVLCEKGLHKESLWLKNYATRIAESEEEAIETIEVWANDWDPPETM